ncbi:MAG: YbaB/EbfC family nucleoid-associated protein [Clostridiaceae bacterium]|jgi:DNA-binding YbaB/EbfC family protein|nr:YbaB/EbfC family nucleoid-associated protein [Clostridiaceae bacterium]
MAKGRRGGFPQGGMRGGGNQMSQLMKQAQKMQEDLAAAQEEVETMKAEATAGGGVVRVVMGAGHQIEVLEINPGVVDPEDIDMLQDLVTAAVNEAARQLDQMTEARMAQITGGGLGFPGF